MAWAGNKIGKGSHLGNFLDVFNKLDDLGKQELMALMVKEVQWDGINKRVVIEMRPSWRVFGDLNLLESSFFYRQTSLPETDGKRNHFSYRLTSLRLSNANQKLFFDQRPITLRFSNGNQKHKQKNNPFLESETEYRPLFTLRDRCKVGAVNVARGRFEIVYPSEAQAIQSQQRRYQIPPPPQPPTIQVLLKQAHRYDKILGENPELSRTDFAKQVGVDPSMLSRILNLLNLAPEIQRHIFNMEPTIYQSPISERRIQVLARNQDHKRQIDVFNRLARIKPRARIHLQQNRVNADENLALAQL